MVTHLVLLAFSYNVVFLFAGTACLGLFLSSTFPSMLAYTEDILQYRGERARVQGERRAGCSFPSLPPSSVMVGTGSAGGCSDPEGFPFQHGTSECDFRPQRSSTLLSPTSFPP